jgi:hypothetical protein
MENISTGLIKAGCKLVKRPLKILLTNKKKMVYYCLVVNKGVEILGRKVEICSPCVFISAVIYYHKKF